MLGFLIKGEVNDDAVRLKTLTDQVLAKYAPMAREKLKEAIVQDFPGDLHHIDSFSVNFVFPTLREFLFALETGLSRNEAEISLSAQGRGKYAGFMLQVSGKDWFSSLSDGITYSATGGAKKLAQVMEKKFGVQDMTKLLHRYR